MPNHIVVSGVFTLASLLLVQLIKIDLLLSFLLKVPNKIWKKQEQMVLWTVHTLSIPNYMHSCWDLGIPQTFSICFDPLKIQGQERHPKCLYLALHVLLIVFMLFAQWLRNIYSWLYITLHLGTMYWVP